MVEHIRGGSVVLNRCTLNCSWPHAMSCKQWPILKQLCAPMGGGRIELRPNRNITVYDLNSFLSYYSVCVCLCACVCVCVFMCMCEDALFVCINRSVRKDLVIDCPSARTFSNQFSASQNTIFFWGWVLELLWVLKADLFNFLSLTGLSL